MNKVMKVAGTMMALGGAGYGMYMMMKSPKTKGQIKKVMKSPYTAKLPMNVNNN